MARPTLSIKAQNDALSVKIACAQKIWFMF